MKHCRLTKLSIGWSSKSYGFLHQKLFHTFWVFFFFQIQHLASRIPEFKLSYWSDLFLSPSNVNMYLAVCRYLWDFLSRNCRMHLSVGFWCCGVTDTLYLHKPFIFYKLWSILHFSKSNIWDCILKSVLHSWRVNSADGCEVERRLSIFSPWGSLKLLKTHTYGNIYWFERHFHATRYCMSNVL